MKKINLGTNLKFVFERENVAEEVLVCAKKIAKTYGYVTVAYIRDLIGELSTYEERLIGWTPEAIEKAYLFKFEGRVTLYLPRCDWEKGERMKEIEDTEESSTGEPINIIISSNEWNTRRNDIEQVLNELLRNSDKIKDHPVFINII